MDVYMLTCGLDSESDYISGVYTSPEKALSEAREFMKHEDGFWDWLSGSLADLAWPGKRTFKDDWNRPYASLRKYMIIE